MLKLLGAGAAAALLTLAGAAAAQTAPAAQTIERAQGEEMMKAMFGQVDANHDGVADAGEQAAILEGAKGAGAPDAALASMRRMFSEGVGADGKVSLASFLRARMIAFDKADTNHDGKLDAAELTAAQTAAEKPKP